jgi:hypothetical protein
VRVRQKQQKVDDHQIEKRKEDPFDLSIHGDPHHIRQQHVADYEQQ